MTKKSSTQRKLWLTLAMYVEQEWKLIQLSVNESEDPEYDEGKGLGVSDGKGVLLFRRQ